MQICDEGNSRKDHPYRIDRRKDDRAKLGEIIRAPALTNQNLKSCLWMEFAICSRESEGEHDDGP